MTNELSYYIDIIPAVVSLIAAATFHIFFITASIAIARSRLGKLSELIDLEAVGAARARTVIEASERYLLCTQLGRLCASLAAGFSLACLTGRLARLGSLQEAPHISWYGLFLGGASAVVFMLATLVCVQIAKAISLQFPEKVLCVVALPLQMIYLLVGPIVVFIHSTVAKVLERFQIHPSSERDLSISADDLSQIAKVSSETGSMEESEQQLIEGIVDFSEGVAREVMTPRKDIVWAKDVVTTDELIALCNRERVSRVLICGNDLDDVRGMILAKDLLRFINQRVSGDAWRTLLRPTYIVPNTKPLDDLLSEMRSKGTHLAVVLDEHGGVGGIVTIEDLVEQIVGEIFDETDRASERESVVMEGEGIWRVDGGVSIDQLPEAFGIEPSEGHYDTIAGYLLFHAGRLPEQGETFFIHGRELTILEIHGHRITRLRVKIPPCEESGIAEGEGPRVANSDNRNARK
jgi:CBS domain containing-hemolysin-like protein